MRTADEYDLIAQSGITLIAVGICLWLLERYSASPLWIAAGGCLTLILVVVVVCLRVRH